MSVPPPASTAVKRVAVLAPDATSLVRSRGDLLRAIATLRHSVTCLVPEDAPGRDALAAWAAAEGVTITSYPVAGGGFFRDRTAATALAALLADLEPHVVLAYGPSGTAAALALAAARAKPARLVVMLTRLDEADRAPARRLLGRRDLPRALRLADAVIVHNREDAASLLATGALDAARPATVVPGAGVDIERFAATPLPPPSAGMTFLCIARRDERSGVLDFCAAARAVRQRAPQARFVLAGPDGFGPGAVDAARLAPYADCVELMGDVTDVRPLLAACHVAVVPSRSEGMPRVLAEALSCGRPVIASAIGGCRDAVDERVNGILVAPGDTAALAAAIESVLKRPDLIPAMSRASRLKAERRFDVAEVNRSVLAVMGLG